MAWWAVTDVASDDLDSLDVVHLRTVLRTAAVADALDACGRREQCLSPEITAQAGDVMVGWAFPVVARDVSTLPEVPYVGLLAALDAIGADEVFVLSTSRSTRAAVWGELVSTACLAAGAVGALTDGVVRDTALIRGMDFPVFGRGRVPYDINGRLDIVAHRQATEIDGVTISPGDLIVGDSDGVVVVPRAAVGEVVHRAIEKSKQENLVRDAVAGGMKPSVAFERYGVL